MIQSIVNAHSDKCRKNTHKKLKRSKSFMMATTSMKWIANHIINHIE